MISDLLWNKQLTVVDLYGCGDHFVLKFPPCDCDVFAFEHYLNGHTVNANVALGLVMFDRILEPHATQMYHLLFHGTGAFVGVCAYCGDVFRKDLLP